LHTVAALSDLIVIADTLAWARTGRKYCKALSTAVVSLWLLVGTEFVGKNQPYVISD
jgi:hypothetical protein